MPACGASARSARYSTATAPSRLLDALDGAEGAGTSGHPGIHASLNAMYETEGVERASRGAVSRELFAWMGKAMAARG